MVALVFATACSTATSEENLPNTDQSAAGDKPLVLTTFTVIADMAQVVAGDHLTVESITKPGAEVHEYEPTPSDLRKAENATLILDNGLGLELWFERFASTARAPHVVVTEGVEPIDIGDGDYTGKPNPHAWMSPTEALTYVDNIADAFTELDPDNSDTYRANADAYKDEIRAIADELRSAVATIPESQRALVTCEGAFSYLARDSGLTEAYLWAVNQEQQGTPRQVVELVKFIQDNNVPTVFCESTVSDRAMQQVARESGAQFGGVLYVDSLSEADGPVPTYLDLLRHDVAVIVEGLTS
ncbi:metal ABC transporter substrate-binding protein [Hoyosella rhizosphaerae]|nr:metal ABC transporter substrate-binding protein [Hoyosella rhizosphaerae]